MMKKSTRKYYIVTTITTTSKEITKKQQIDCDYSLKFSLNAEVELWSVYWCCWSWLHVFQFLFLLLLLLTCFNFILFYNCVFIAFQHKKNNFSCYHLVWLCANFTIDRIKKRIHFDLKQSIVIAILIE